MDLKTVDLSSIVTIILEDTGATIKVHEDVLCAHSEFARACLNGTFVEAKEKEIILRDEVDYETLRTLIGWMYQSEVKSSDCRALNAGEDKDVYENHWSRMAKLYMVADKYLMIGFRNDILSYWVDQIAGNKYGSLQFFSALEILLDREIDASPLKRLLVDALVVDIHTNISSGEESDFLTNTFDLWTQDLRTLLHGRPELANSILQGLLEPHLPEFSRHNYCDNKRRQVASSSMKRKSC